MKRIFILLLVVAVCISCPKALDAQYNIVYQALDTQISPASQNIWIVRYEGTKQIVLFNMDSLHLNLGTTPKFDLLGKTLFCANAYVDYHRNHKPVYKFVFASYQVNDTALILSEKFARNFSVAKGRRVWFEYQLQDRKITLTQTEQGVFDISASLDLSLYREGDIQIFFNRFKSMCRPAIPRIFQQLRTDILLESL
jgi:hypothetical protein